MFIKRDKTPPPTCKDFEPKTTDEELNAGCKHSDNCKWKMQLMKPLGCHLSLYCSGYTEDDLENKRLIEEGLL